uniref:Mitochondrial protein n=1 Tax=Lactuca sativa TaxID=4236 RepID=A0A9R1VDL4_LACSA|nr:hypothetical protein LSAT_V11C500252710 [Lactuca sativa]
MEHGDGLFFFQAKYANDILTRPEMLNAISVSTPLSTTDCLVSQGSSYFDPMLYQYLVSQFLHAPAVDHYQAIKPILRYIKGTLAYGLHFNSPPTSSLIGYTNVEWAKCTETCRSTYGYSIFLGGNLFSWSAKKQPTVSPSSCEYGYRSMANTAPEIVWVTHLLLELHALPSDRPTLLCDNRSSLLLNQNPIFHKRAKHIDIGYHFVQLYTRFVPMSLQLTNIFTKSLPRPPYENFRSKLGVAPPSLRLRGGYVCVCVSRWGGGGGIRDKISRYLIILYNIVVSF